MPHPAITSLTALLGPPSTGGDTVDWDELERSTGLRLPADYRDFVGLYGGGELNEYLSISSPPVEGSPDGDLVDNLDFDPRQAPVEPTGTSQKELEDGRLLLVAQSVNSDVVFWLCDDLDPEGWEIVVFKRQVLYGEQRWTRYAMGFGEFLLSALTGTLANPFSDRSWANPPHTYRHWSQPI